jgi:hypothetical protein
MLRPRRALPLFPLRHRFLHQLGSTAPGTSGKSGKVGFLIVCERNFHAIQSRIAARCVNKGPQPPLDFVSARATQRPAW